MLDTSMQKVGKARQVSKQAHGAKAERFCLRLSHGSHSSAERSRCGRGSHAALEHWRQAVAAAATSRRAAVTTTEPSRAAAAAAPPPPQKKKRCPPSASTARRRPPCSGRHEEVTTSAKKHRPGHDVKLPAVMLTSKFNNMMSCFAASQPRRSNAPRSWTTAPPLHLVTQGGEQPDPLITNTQALVNFSEQLLDHEAVAGVAFDDIAFGGSPGRRARHLQM